MMWEKTIKPKPKHYYAQRFKRKFYLFPKTLPMQVIRDCEYKYVFITRWLEWATSVQEYSYESDWDCPYWYWKDIFWATPDYQLAKGKDTYHGIKKV